MISIKTIAIAEPYLTEIMRLQKLMETRSWCTKYRGWIYLYCPHKMYKDTPKNLKKTFKMLFKDDFKKNKGKVIGKARLIDCIEMTQEFIDSVSEKEKRLGFFSVGRYAWILEDVQYVEPFEAKGMQKLFESERK